ncbi:MAG: GNAT family N-acetyltransferase [Flavobacteriales bacterium]|nr:GNAT family N-acetyltransferase [Flavobacteriales bacterium]
MKIEYKVGEDISVDQFQDLLYRSTLGERRPVDDTECLKGMLANSNLVITAWLGDKLVGISRCVTDFHYCCYLSDLAVDTDYQKNGVGKQLQILTQGELGPKCNLILLAAPAANSYYKHIGFANNERCWVLGRDQEINV